jgi:hypothetical protein
MSLQLEQNLYSIYRLFLKLPKWIFLGLMLFLVVVAIGLMVNMSRNSERPDVSQCLFDYLIQKVNSRDVPANTTQGEGEPKILLNL